jgi:2-succinyl-5-enolpyruvyl-6-hydroxy-3-cyclohexene-1-carboxylate synthase
MLLPFFSSDIALQSANSSVIRYIQLFKEGRAADHFCNRGTSGIDGSTSTAAGYCYASGRKTVLITGDISFLYDSNGLYHNYKKNNFKIILINNGGGGIFRIIDGPKDSQYLESFFEARQEMSGEHFARAYGLNYQLATSETELAAQLGDFFAKDEAPTILEIRTPGRENAQVLKTYFGYLRHGNESSGVV